MPDTVEPRDIAEASNPAAPDPTPDEVTDPAHPDHVEPYTGASPCDEHQED